nr:hypothetical protein CFP56_32548 [Quercus suber]POF16266.1 hypothetical protein CFP56_23784 [Quercus suber]
MNLDDMLKRIDSPFTASVLECHLPPKFRLLQLEFYDVTKDPLDDIGAFKTILNLQQTLDEVIYKSFPATLRGATRAGLNNPDFIFLLGKMSSTSMTNLLFKAQKYMNREDALTAKGVNGKAKEIKEFIQREKLRKFIKRDHHPRVRTDDKPHDDAKDDGRDQPRQAVCEIRTITGGPVSGGSYKSLKKIYHRQINSIHINHPSLMYRRSESDDITFSERDARGIKQPHEEPLVILLEIEGFNTDKEHTDEVIIQLH